MNEQQAESVAKAFLVTHRGVRSQALVKRADARNYRARMAATALLGLIVGGGTGYLLGDWFALGMIGLALGLLVERHRRSSLAKKLSNTYSP